MPITTQKLHAVLRKAGLSCSKTHTTRIRGWYDRTTGYCLEKIADGTIRISCYQNRYLLEDESSELATYLDRCKVVLDQAGIAYRLSDRFIAVPTDEIRAPA